MAEIFACLMTRPVTSCGWEQPFEAMMQALTQTHPENFNFRRSDAHLVVLFLTSEDDCTPTTAELFNPGTLDTLGPYNGFRCWRWGVRCDRDWLLNPENLFEDYTGCRPRLESEGGKLVDVSSYVNELKSLGSDQGKRYFVSAISMSGPHQTSVRVENWTTYWQVAPVQEVEGAVMPNLRLYDFTWRLNQLPEDMQWTFFSILDPDWELPLNRLGQRLRDVMERSMTAE